MQISHNFFISLFPLWSIVSTTTIMLLLICWKRVYLLNIIFVLICLLLIFIFNLLIKVPYDIFSLLRVDKLSILYTSIILISILISIIYSFHWLQNKKNTEEFYILLLIFTLGAYILINSHNMISFFLGIELISIPLFGLMGYSIQKKYSLESTIKYFILSCISSLFLLLGICLLYTFAGNLSFYYFENITKNHILYPIFLLGISLIMVGIGFKLSLFPFHFWTPDIYQGSPNTVSYLISSITKISVCYAFMKIAIFIPDFSKIFHTSLSIIACMSILFGNIMAIIQKNIKRFLAYSSISHFGYLLIAFIANQSHSFFIETMTLSLISYLLSNIIIFGIIHIFYCSDNSKKIDLTKSYSGLFWNFPCISFSFIIALLSLAGIPITLGFISKFYIFIMAINANLWWVIAVTVLGSIISIYYYFKIIVILFCKTYIKNHLVEKNVYNKIIIFFSSFLILLFGIFPNGLINFIHGFLQ